MPSKTAKGKVSKTVSLEQPIEETKLSSASSSTAPPKDAKSDEYITLDLQTVVIPAAILLSAVIISIILVFGFRNLKSSITASRDAILDAVGGNPTTTDTTGTTAETATGSTSIGTSPYLGDRSKAKVAIVEFSDYECPFCIRHAKQTYPQMITDLVDSGDAIYVYRDNIAVPSHNPVATEEAMAAKCVQKIAGNEAYFTFHDNVFATTTGNGQGKKSDLYVLASEIGLDSTAFSQCLDGEQTKNAVTADIADAADAGMSGTPGFIVGTLSSDGTVTGDIIRGAYPFDTFKTAVDKYL
ncbi:hypothetical protein AUK40_04465 [Candidatus Wirthbacteria bacterium CG2_30_54_11]|uniref:Thioredoxin domain-containing protein n=1 Tax=Candidatus Wirthbacteria bacterium CG2_30_54_11 TaxID=1817892 RepID=A0A1J5III9_9BACT|nr:MAG: hypothetical protein AUK40_04465 [Candidatus Wirthbacteria bacterium CG2_30_54_11]